MVFLSSTVGNAPGPRRYSMSMARLGILSHARMGARAEEGEIGHRVAIDIGGTFTDLAAVDVPTGERAAPGRVKAQTNPLRNRTIGLCVRRANVGETVQLRSRRSSG